MRALLVLLEFAWCGGLARSSRPSTSLKVEEAAAAAFLVEVVVIDEAYDGGGAGFEAWMCSSTSP